MDCFIAVRIENVCFILRCHFQLSKVRMVCHTGRAAQLLTLIKLRLRWMKGFTHDDNFHYNNCYCFSIGTYQLINNATWTVKHWLALSVGIRSRAPTHRLRINEICQIAAHVNHWEWKRWCLGHDFDPYVLDIRSRIACQYSREIAL